MNVLFYLLPVLVIGWTIWSVFDYKKLKLALSKGNRAELIKEYKLTILGEIIGGFLALLAVGTSIFHPLSSFDISLGSTQKSLVGGAAAGLVISLLIVLLLAKRKDGKVTVGDIEPLFPKTTIEKYYFAGVAISAGICEELIFRGFGLRLLHSIGLTGLALLIVSAVVFGLAHIYQGLAGVAATAAIGLFLAVTYIISGSLLVPIVLHALMNLRILIMTNTTHDAHAKM